MKIYFTNIDNSAMSAGETKAARELRARIETEFADAAAAASAELKKAFDEGVGRVAEGYFGSFIVSLLRRTPRYAYIKNMNSAGEHDDGADVCIDLIAHEYRTEQHVR